MARLLGVLALSGVLLGASRDARPNLLFLIADDWGWPHAGAYGDKVVKTPNFDRVASEGVLFTHAFCASPSCTPSRAAILSGQAIHRLGATANLWSSLPADFVGYPDLLAKAGYEVGLTGKGWGPGEYKTSGRLHNPAGPAFPSFEGFLKSVRPDKPFCFWFGSKDPHRIYEKGSGRASGMKPEDVAVPPFLPDTPEVRDDILDYYFEVQRFDRDVGTILEALRASGRADNSIVVITSDNGMPFPRAKANLHDSGTRMPLAIRWPARVKGGRTVDAFVSHCDVAPTFLEAAGVEAPAAMTGRSLLGLLTTGTVDGRTHTFVGRERHAMCRKENVGYPARAIRTREFFYVRNSRPDRWPSGDPEPVGIQGAYGDSDRGPSKDVVISLEKDAALGKYFDLAFGKRPAEELYDLAKDPAQLRNVAADPAYAETKQKLRARLDAWLAATADPRTAKDDDAFDRYAYTAAYAQKK